VRLVPDEGNDHAVQVEEKHDQVEAELDKGFLCDIRYLLFLEAIYVVS
jgi:hypothetical protein